MLKPSLGLIWLLAVMPAFAATPIELEHQSTSFLATHILTNANVTLTETTRLADFNNTLHIRLQQTIHGVPVWGGDAIMHIPQAGMAKRDYASLMTANTTMNGTVYDQWQKDLIQSPDHVFNAAQKQRAINEAIAHYQATQVAMIKPTAGEAKEIIFIDDQQTAHYAYQVSFVTQENKRVVPVKPTFIMDAGNLQIYQQWNDMKSLENVKAGGFGGNHKTGKKEFDGLPQHQSALSIQRDAASATCTMQNQTMGLIDNRNDEMVSFPCKTVSTEHNNVYWNGSFDKVETTWSPSNDAMFGGQVTWDMFHDWYNMPPLTNKGKPMYLKMIVHDPVENAYWDGAKVIFGDSKGSKEFNPFTQLDTVSHEICHGFTEQHSNLAYYSQSGGLNEAFSDMAGIAAEYYAYGSTSFLVGWGDVKAEGEALRYMEKPSKDCKGRAPGKNCSIDNMSQFNDNIDVHHSSGVFNRAYYLLSNTPEWNAHKAFDVMVQANANYWTSKTTFAKAACGVLSAAKDYHYDQAAVINAFHEVGLDVTKCGK